MTSKGNYVNRDLSLGNAQKCIQIIFKIVFYSSALVLTVVATYNVEIITVKLKSNLLSLSSHLYN